MTQEEHKKEVEKLQEIEIELDNLIALSNGNKLYSAYLKWKKQRTKCNEGFTEVLKGLLSKGPN